MSRITLTDDLFFMKKVKYYLPEILVFLLFFCFYLYPRIVTPYLFSYAGLYMEMSESILKYQFALPLTIPYYGPGGIPFTYPPLGFYLCAFTMSIFKISTMQYVRFAPILFYTGALIAFYILVRKITKSRAKGLISTFLYGTSNIGYIYHSQESGMVRGLALLFTLIGLVAFYNVNFKAKNNWSIVVGVLCLACTALTHFNYLLFFIISIPVFIVFGTQKISERLLFSFCMCVAAILLIVPWLIVVFSRFGIDPFLSASGTHGNLLQTGILILQFQDWDVIALALALLGFFYAIFKKNWLMLVWFIVTFLFVGEGSRFLFLLGTALCAEIIIDFYNLEKPISENQRKFQLALRLLPVLFLLSFFGRNFVLYVRNSNSLDIPNLISLGSWFTNRTCENASYLFITTHNDYGYNENMPYFIKRTPVILPWGGEWTNQYDEQMSMSISLTQCILQDSMICITSLIQKYSLSPDFLIIYNKDNSLTQSLVQSESWQQVYENPKFKVFQR